MKLTRKQKDFADKLLSEPKKSATQVVREVYNVKKQGSSARTIAAQNLAKPSIQLYLNEHGDKALRDNLEIAEYSKEMGKTFSTEGAKYAQVAAGINKDLVDRVIGKPKQQIEMQSTVVTLSLSFKDIVSD